MILLLVLLAVAMIALGPLAAIWALNVLFGFAIAFTFKTWVAALVLINIVAHSSYTKK
jgi:hypothetical protein